MSAAVLPALVVLCMALGVARNTRVYDAFVRGAEEGLRTALRVAPNLVAVVTATALMRESGLLDALTQVAAPALEHMGIPAQAVGVVLLRPLSGSASLAMIGDVMTRCGADSRAGRFACVVSGANETVFLTLSLYLGAAGVEKGKYALPAAMAGYAAGVIVTALLI